MQNDYFRKHAFAELLHARYEDRLCRWFVGLGTPRDQAFDLAQDMFLKLYRTQLGGYDSGQPFHSYLFAAARNLWIDMVHRRRAPRAIDQLEERPAPPSDVAEVVALQEQTGWALARVPAPHREVLLLSMVGNEPGAIARQLGRPVRAVYQHLFKARQAMAEHLGIVRPPSVRGRKPKGA